MFASSFGEPKCGICNLPETPRSKFIECYGVCHKNYHLKCMGLPVGAVDICSKYSKNVTFRCNKCCKITLDEAINEIKTQSDTIEQLRDSFAELKASCLAALDDSNAKMATLTEHLVQNAGRESVAGTITYAVDCQTEPDIWTTSMGCQTDPVLTDCPASAECALKTTDSVLADRNTTRKKKKVRGKNTKQKEHPPQLNTTELHPCSQSSTPESTPSSCSSASPLPQPSQLHSLLVPEQGSPMTPSHNTNTVVCSIPELKMSKPPKSLFISRLDANTTSLEVAAYIKAKCGIPEHDMTAIRCVKLSSNRDTAFVASFRVYIPDEYFVTVLDRHFWSEGLIVREYTTFPVGRFDSGHRFRNGRRQRRS